jgi:hypothetical protein
VLLESDPTAVRRGYTSGGVQLQTSCFHIPNYAGKDFGILLDGADAVDPDSIFLGGDPGATAKLAETIWSVLALTTEDRTPQPCTLRPHDGGAAIYIDTQGLVELNAAANNDLCKIAAYRRASLTRVDGLAVRDLATIAFDLDNQEARSAFGAACLGILPIISGIGRVIA